MRRLRFGGTKQLVYILAPGEKPLPGEICFAQDELQWAERLANAMQEKEARTIFWQGVFESKLANTNYSVFDSFAKEEIKAPPPPPRREDPPGAPKEVAKRYCEEILRSMGRRTG